MYSFEGNITELACETQKIIDKIEFCKEPYRNNSFTIVLFRIDPIDNYRYLLAHAGLREKETMFFPKERNDHEIYKTEPKKNQEAF